MAISEATKEAMYLRGLLKDTSKSCEKIMIFNDSQGAQSLIKSKNVYHSRTKHIDLRHHFVRERCEAGDIALYYIPPNDMPADMLTKSLSSKKLLHCQDGLEMMEMQI